MAKGILQDILLVKIHNTLQEGQDLYEATRQKWRLSTTKLREIQYVVGINRGKVVCVYIPEEWHVITQDEAEDPKDVGRKRFSGKEAPNEILVRLQNQEKMLADKFGSGAAIAYAGFHEIE